ncbi:Maltose excess protein 1 chloroplastic, partial [Bienertia sinuspersici]
MVAAIADPAFGQSLLQPNRLSLSHHFPLIHHLDHGISHPSPPSFNFKNHDCNSSSSSQYSFTTSPSLRHLHQRFKPSAEAVNININDETLKQWDGWTTKFAVATNIPFLLLQLSQIWLNACNLMSGNYSALLAVNWLGSLTSLLGIFCCFIFFQKRETKAMIVHCLGVVTTYAIVSQLAIAEAMPSLYFTFLCCGRRWCYLQFSQLLWHASIHNLGYLGRFHHN